MPATNLSTTADAPTPAGRALVKYAPASARDGHRRQLPGWVHILAAMAALYLFIASINTIGHGMKTIATVPESQAFLQEHIFALASHPLAGLSIGILLTAIVQSSSFTTSFVVGLVVAGQINLTVAVPIIMGANIGTSITALLVSLAHVRRRNEFRRSLAAATVHDQFNLLTVILLVPLEMAFGILSRPAEAFAEWLKGTSFLNTNPKKFAFVKMAVKPLADGSDWLFGDILGLSPTAAGAATAIVAVLLLFCALIFLVRMLQGLVKNRLAGLFNKTFFRNSATSFIVGIVGTAAVQSSSVTTSLVVPLVGAGILTIKQVFPYMLGANIGTTVTALLAGLALAAMAAGTGEIAEAAAASGLALAMAHLLFNVIGTIIFWPISWLPIAIAKGYAKLASRRRLLAVAYVLIIFFLLPILIIILTNR